MWVWGRGRQPGGGCGEGGWCGSGGQRWETGGRARRAAGSNGAWPRQRASVLKPHVGSRGPWAPGLGAVLQGPRRRKDGCEQAAGRLGGERSCSCGHARGPVFGAHTGALVLCRGRTARPQAPQGGRAGGRAGGARVAAAARGRRPTEPSPRSHSAAAPRPLGQPGKLFSFVSFIFFSLF